MAKQKGPRPMPDDEITNSFRLAKNKREQIAILADLNLCSPYEIATLLYDHGELAGTNLRPDQSTSRYSPVKGAAPKPKAKQKTKPPKAQPHDLVPFDELRAMELYNDGLDDIAIADALGVTVKRVQNWRYRMHLLRPRGGYNRKPKTEEEKPVKSHDEQMADKLENADNIGVSEASAPLPEDAEQVKPDTSPTEPEQTLTVAEFLALCTELLTPALIKAPLFLNGVPVREVAGIHILPHADALRVDILTEAG